MDRARMVRRAFVQTVAGVVFLLAGSEVGAQVAWDSPLLVSPNPQPGWGVYLLDPAGRDEIGVMAGWRGSGNLGFRVGISDDEGEDGLNVFGGVDVSGSLMRASSSFPLDVSWVAGAGLGAGDAVLASFPFGVTMGRDLTSEGIRFTPYISPRVILDAWFGDDRPNDDLSLNFAIDLGADVAFSPRWAIRFGGTVGDHEAMAVGIAVQQ